MKNVRVCTCVCVRTCVHVRVLLFWNAPPPHTEDPGTPMMGLSQDSHPHRLTAQEARSAPTASVEILPVAGRGTCMASPARAVSQWNSLTRLGCN